MEAWQVSGLLPLRPIVSEPWLLARLSLGPRL